MKLSTIGVELLRSMGFIGSTDPLSSIVPRSNAPSSNQELMDDFLEAGRIANPDIWTKYASATKRPASMDQVLDLWEEMATWDLMSAALTEMVEEVIQRDSLNPGTIWVECNNQDIEDDINEMFEKRLHVEDIIASQAWYLAGLGNHIEKLDYSAQDGIVGMSFVHPKRIRRYWLERNRQCIGFRWFDRKPRKSDTLIGLDGVTEIPRAALAIDGTNLEELWYPWDFMHIRRMFRMRSSEYGEAIYDEAQGIYKKLRMAIDQMVVHRAQVQPDRYVVNIDVQESTPTEQLKIVQRWKQALRAKQSFGQGNTTDLNQPNDFRSFYNPWALDSVLWVARPKGFSHSVEKLQGTQNIPDVYDIELLTDLFYSIIGMPKAWFGLGQSDGGAAPSGKALLASDIRFLRKVKSLRRPLIEQYTWLGNFHAILKGHGQELESLNIQAKMSDIGGLEDQMKMELLNIQADILSKLADIMTAYNLPKEAWIELIFKRYLHLPDDIVNVLMTALPTPIERENPLEHRSSAPDMKAIMEAIKGRLDHRRDDIRHKLREALNMKTKSLYMRPSMTYSCVQDVLGMPALTSSDRILTESEKDVQIADQKYTSRETVEVERNGHKNGHHLEPGWRRYISPRKVQ